MMNRREILTRINEVITDEKGIAVTMEGMFTDTELDSLGVIITLITIDSEFHIFDPENTEKDLSALDIKNLTIRDLVTKCLLSTTNTSAEQKTEETT